MIECGNNDRRERLYFTLFHLSRKDIRSLMAAALTQWRLTSFHYYNCYTLIYIFILTVGFFSSFFFFFGASPISLSCRGIESGESWVMILSGVVKIHLALQFNSILTQPFIYIYGTIKINWFGLQSAWSLFTKKSLSRFLRISIEQTAGGGVTICLFKSCQNGSHRS